MFTNKDLKNLIAPLFLEKLLVLLVGIADTFIVSYAGEAAVSGVSLVNSFSTIFIYIITALASGGAVIISQYIGRGVKEDAGETASQLLTASTLLAIIVSILILVLHRPLLGLFFGQVDPSVMDACIIYLQISVFSYPALAVYNAGAALYRSMGKTNVTMYISVAANAINVVGNLIGVFGLKAGVAGVAWPTLIARVFSAVVITGLCFGKRVDVCYTWRQICKWNTKLMKRILCIAVPNGVENGIFQMVKVALSSVVALFGTYQIAANGIAQSIWSLAALAGVAMGPVFITVIGQCMGAGDTDQAEHYFRKLLKITLTVSLIWNVLVFAITPIMMNFYRISDEAKHLVIILVLIHNIFNTVAFPMSGPLGNGLRAAGDIRFTMIVSISSTIGGRLALSVLLAIGLNWGVIGIAVAMCLDWVIRAVIFTLRLRSGKWKEFKVI